jgi:hypothetical protein
MANQCVTLFMVCDGHIACVALQDSPAPGAQDKSVKPAPIEEQHHLSGIIESGVHGPAQRV